MINKNNKKNILIILFSVLGIICITLGVTYSFFNYTRTGSPNTFSTGRIYFNSTQNGTLNLTNVFPVKSSEVNSSALDSVTITINGDTTYADGEEFLISITDVNNTINNKQIPLNYIATYTANTGGNIGTSSNDYWNARESKDSTIYQLNNEGKVSNGKQILVGYIDNGESGINGTITIKVYVDADRIAITDTPDENTEWQQGRTVFSTSEWNSFQSNGTGISFKIKTESNEGIWVTKEPTDISCFEYTVTENNATITEYKDDCEKDVIIPNKLGGYDVTEIGTSAFAGKSLTSVVFPEGIKTIGKTAFSNNDISRVVIPDSVTYIDYAAFSSNKLISVNIPTSVTYIGSGAFTSNLLTNININNDQLIIDDGAFSSNPISNVNIKINNGEIKNSAFAASDTLTNVEIEGENLIWDANTFGSYSANEIDKNIKINTPSIPNAAFASKKVINLTLGDYVKTIGSNSFISNKIQTLVIPENVTTIGDSAFMNNNINNIQIEGHDLRSIGNNAFLNNHLISITIPTGIETIGNSAFQNNQLETVNIGDSNAQISNLVSIGSGAFMKSSSSNPNLLTINFSATYCTNLRNMNYYPWLYTSSPYTASGVTINAILDNIEVCNTY